MRHRNQDQRSGAKASRPGLDQLIADARRRKFDIVVCWKLDRFGRSLVHCVSGAGTPASVRVRAADIFSHAAKAIEIEDIEARLSELERATEASKQSKNTK